MKHLTWTQGLICEATNDPEITLVSFDLRINGMMVPMTVGINADLFELCGYDDAEYHYSPYTGSWEPCEAVNGYWVAMQLPVARIRKW